MVTKTETPDLSDLIKWEADSRYSREVWQMDASDVGSGTVLQTGDILEPGTDATKKQVLATAANADSILIGCYDKDDVARSELLTKYTTEDNSTDFYALILIRDAIVDHAVLDYQSQTESTVDAALKDEDILVRTGPTYTEGPLKT